MRASIRRVQKVIQADFGQECSTHKLKLLLAYPLNWRSLMRGFGMPILVPILILSLTWIPLDPPNQGFRGRNVYILLVATVGSVFLAFVFDTRMVSMIPMTRLNHRQRLSCAMALVISVVTFFSFSFTLIKFPFPFGTFGCQLHKASFA